MNPTTSLPSHTWTPPVGAVLFNAIPDFAVPEPTDLYCPRCGNRTVRGYQAYIGGRGFQPVQHCTAWYTMADGRILECGEAA